MKDQNSHHRFDADSRIAPDKIKTLATLTHAAKERLRDCAELIERMSGELDRLTAPVETLASKQPRQLQERLLSLEEVAMRLGVTTVTLMKMRKAGDLPEPIHVSARRRAYREAEIETWLKNGGAAHRRDGVK